MAVTNDRRDLVLWNVNSGIKIMSLEYYNIVDLSFL